MSAVEQEDEEVSQARIERLLCRARDAVNDGVKYAKNHLQQWMHKK